MTAKMRTCFRNLALLFLLFFSTLFSLFSIGVLTALFL